MNQTNALVRAWRVLYLGLLIFVGVLGALCVFPLGGERGRLRFLAAWSAVFLKGLGIQVEADVQHAVPGTLLIANHISWIDIFVINAVLPSAFISKEEVRHWPIIGWLATKNDTVFLRRGRRGHARVINDQISQLLADGRHVTVFPEGTTTDGTRLLPFYAALLQPALLARHPVLPVALSYWEPDGQRSLAPRYDGDISLGQCLTSILGRKRQIARLVSTPELGLNGEDRRQVASEAREAIALAAGLPQPNNRPETPADLPGARRSDGHPINSQSLAPASLA